MVPELTLKGIPGKKLEKFLENCWRNICFYGLQPYCRRNLVEKNYWRIFCKNSWTNASCRNLWGICRGITGGTRIRIPEWIAGGITGIYFFEEFLVKFLKGFLEEFLNGFLWKFLELHLKISWRNLWGTATEISVGISGEILTEILEGIAEEILEKLQGNSWSNPWESFWRDSWKNP